MGDPEGSAAEGTQQAQAGCGHEVVESFVQQITRTLVDGSAAHEAPPPTAAAVCFGVSNGERNGARRDEGHMLTCGARSGGVSETVDRRRKWTPC